MNKALDRKLCKKYPEIFADRHKPITQTAMSFGFECGDGWFNLIDKLCNDLMKSKNEVPVATQVKEKFGTLRFYVQAARDEDYRLITKAEKDSETICEVCGRKGRLREKRTWLKTLCDKDAIKLGYENESVDVDEDGHDFQCNIGINRPCDCFKSLEK